jgi:hypothetical protein
MNDIDAKTALTPPPLPQPTLTQDEVAFPEVMTFDEAFFNLGIDALDQTTSRIQALLQRVWTVIRFISRTPWMIAYGTGAATITLLGAAATRRGHALIVWRTYRTARFVQRQIIAIARSLQRALVAARRSFVQTVRAARAKSRAQTRALISQLHNRLVRRRVLHLMREHKRDSYQIQALHQRLDLLRKRKSLLEAILEDLLDDSVASSRDHQSESTLRRDYAEEYRRTKV